MCAYVCVYITYNILSPSEINQDSVDISPALQVGNLATRLAHVGAAKNAYLALGYLLRTKKKSFDWPFGGHLDLFFCIVSPLPVFSLTLPLLILCIKDCIGILKAHTLASGTPKKSHNFGWDLWNSHFGQTMNGWEHLGCAQDPTFASTHMAQHGAAARVPTITGCAAMLLRKSWSPRARWFGLVGLQGWLLFI